MRNSIKIPYRGVGETIDKIYRRGNGYMRVYIDIAKGNIWADEHPDPNSYIEYLNPDICYVCRFDSTIYGDLSRSQIRDMISEGLAELSRDVA